MKVSIRFLAFQQQLPREFTQIELCEDAVMADLLKSVGEKWGDQLKGYWNENAHAFTGDILVASQGRMLQSGEKLIEGQQLQLIGQIIGG